MLIMTRVMMVIIIKINEDGYYDNDKIIKMVFRIIAIISLEFTKLSTCGPCDNDFLTAHNNYHYQRKTKQNIILTPLQCRHCWTFVNIDYFHMSHGGDDILHRRSLSSASASAAIF